jgi:hypothetical protein
LNIIYYTRGITGWGHIIIGISICNALKRKSVACNYTIVSSSDAVIPFADVNHIRILLEDENALSATNYYSSVLYKTITDIKPDVILFDLIWFTMYNFINELSCKKIFLCHQVPDKYFSIDLPDRKMIFNPNHYDKIIGIEPFKSNVEMDLINPVVYRNKNEIYSKEEACKKLHLGEKKPTCLFSFNPRTGNFNKYLKKYSYLEDIYQMIYAHEYQGKLFPEVDFFNAFDFIVCGGGYSQFWEAIYFNKETIFEPLPLVFESQSRRIQECQEYYFEENGADQLVDIIMNL